jgi:diguanylate cyclase (GGDEF)-like protein
VRAVTEVRIEAARYANPLTFLPGNIPISSHIARLLGNDAAFYACYVDLNHFKPFNDQYGYWQGDEVLKFAAMVLADVCDPTRDFLGHVGGDDFLILFQSDDWQDRVMRAIHVFNRTTASPAAFTAKTAAATRPSSALSRWRSAACTSNPMAGRRCTAARRLPRWRRSPSGARSRTRRVLC